MHPLISATCRAIVEDGHDVSASERCRLWLAVATTLHRAARSHSKPSDLNWADGYRLVPHIAALVGNLPSHSTTDALEEAVLAAVVAMEDLYRTGAHHYAEQLGRDAFALSQSLPRDNAAALSIAYALARTLMDRGQLGEAKDMLQTVLEARQRTLGLEHEASLDALEMLAALQHRRGDLNQAEQMLRQVANGRERSSGTASATRIRALHALVRILGEQGKLGEMERVNRHIVSAARDRYGPDNQETLSAESELGVTLRTLGRLEESERILSQVLDLQTRLLGEEAPDVISTLEELAVTHRGQGRLAAAEEALKRVLNRRRVLLGSDDLYTVNAMAELAETFRDLARYDESESLLREVLQARARILGPDHPDTLNVQLGLAVILRDTGRLEESGEILREIITACRTSIGPDHPIALSARHNLAAVFQDTGRISSAEQLYREVLDKREWVLGPNHPETLRTTVNLASLLHRRGSLDEAEHMLRQASDACTGIYGASHPNSMAIKNNIANIYLDSGRVGEAQRIYQEVLDAQQASLGRHHPDTLIACVNLAVANADQGETAKAEELLEEAIQGYKRAFRDQDHPSLLAARYHLARIREQRGDLQGAYTGYLSVFTSQENVPGDSRPDVITARLSLSRVLGELGRKSEAESLYQEAIRQAIRMAVQPTEIRGRIRQHGPPPTMSASGPLTKSGIYLRHESPVPESRQASPAEQAAGRGFWGSLTPAERRALAAVAVEQTFAHGARLMSEGEQANHVMVILSGRTQITVLGDDAERVVAERGPGQLVGERGALRLNVRSATAIAVEMVRALVIRTEDFAGFISTHPRVLDVVENQIYDRLTEDPEGYGQDGWAGAFPLQLVSRAPLDGLRSQPPAGENCTVLLTDVVGFGARHRSDKDRQVIRHGALEMIRESLGPLWGTCISEDRGDGLLIVVPPRVPTTRIMECVHRELPGRLRLHNHTYRESARINLRVAVNVGPVMGDPVGMSGDAIIRTARLVEAPVLKEAMAATGVGLGIIVSPFVYETAIEQASDLIDADEYKMIEASNKEFRSTAWMRLIDLAPPRSPVR